MDVLIAWEWRRVVAISHGRRLKITGRVAAEGRRGSVRGERRHPTWRHLLLWRFYLASMRRMYPHLPSFWCAFTVTVPGAS
jgi:hypothetical protein